MQELGTAQTTKIPVWFKSSTLHSRVNIGPKFINFETFFDFFKMISTPRFDKKTNKIWCKNFKSSPLMFIACPTSILEQGLE